MKHVVYFLSQYGSYLSEKVSPPLRGFLSEGPFNLNLVRSVYVSSFLFTTVDYTSFPKKTSEDYCCRTQVTDVRSVIDS